MPTLPSPFARVYNIEPILSLIPSHQWQWHRLPVHRLQFFFLVMRSSYTANSLIPSIEEVQQFNCLATNRLPGKLPPLQHLPLLVKGTPRAWIHYTEHVIPFHSSFVRFLRGPNWIISTAIDRCRSISDIFLWARPWTSVGGLFTANTGPWYNARGRRTVGKDFKCHLNNMREQEPQITLLDVPFSWKNCSLLWHTIYSAEATTTTGLHLVVGTTLEIN